MSNPTETIKIKVSNTTFKIPKHLVPQIPFFATALDPSPSKTLLSLPNENPQTFKTYLTYLRTRKIPTSLAHPALAKLYVLGEALLDRAFQGAVMTAIMDNCEDVQDFPCAEAIATIYAGTPEGSPARRLLVDLWVWAGEVGWLCDEDFEQKGYIRELVGGLLEGRNRPYGEVPWECLRELYCYQGSEWVGVCFGGWDGMGNG
ncbi:hypothetical protein GQ44DRAFT_758602 [Phaeosphaeriaceae sp. PMI808]|nr:hypothetical protein GQ44DRAFT_758602 [Phaeosphaeriaceae sp. PMI808]